MPIAVACPANGTLAEARGAGRIGGSCRVGTSSPAGPVPRTPRTPAVYSLRPTQHPLRPASTWPGCEVALRPVTRAVVVSR